MDRRNQPPAAFWGESLNFWCRLWQIQIEQTVRFWGAMAAHMPRPTSAELAAEAESIKATRKLKARNAASSRSTAARTTRPRSAKKTAYAKPARKPGAKPDSAPMH